MEHTPLGEKLRPFLVFDRGYWKQTRFINLDRCGWGWSIPWKRRTLIGAQLELLNFPNPPDKPLEILVWKRKYSRSWRRIIGMHHPSDAHVWDVLTGDLVLKASTIITLQKERWNIEVLFGWLKQHTTIKQPLGENWMSFITHCLLVTLLHIILVYFLLLLGFSRWRDHLTLLLENFRYSDSEPWPVSYILCLKQLIR